MIRNLCIAALRAVGAQRFDFPIKMIIDNWSLIIVIGNFQLFYQPTFLHSI